LLASDATADGYALAVLDMLQQSGNVIASPDEALNVMDFEPAARKALPPAHFGYLATGVDDDGTVRANREGYSQIEIRSRRLVDVAKVDMSEVAAVQSIWRWSLARAARATAMSPSG